MQEMMNLKSIIKLLPVAFALFELHHAQEIPQEFRTKFTVTENEWCFTAGTKSSCLPGYHQNHQYTDCSLRRQCCPCPQGTFQPQPNICNSCIECKNCSKTNQEVSIHCNETHDAKCGDPPSTDIHKVVYAPSFVFIMSLCVLVAIILCTGRITCRAWYSLAEGKSKHKKKRGSHPEELITMEDRRGSKVTEMELRWLAKIVCKYNRYLEKHTSLYGYLNIEAGAVTKIKYERLSNNSFCYLETEIFTILHYGRLERDNRTEEEDSRGHLIKQLYTFDRKLAETYAEYINQCEDFSIMWSV